MNNEFMKCIYNYENELGDSENILKGNLLKDDEKDLIIHNPNAFLFGLISDQSVKAETAWSLPYKLKDRMGTFEMKDIISKYNMDDIQQFIREKPALHRYPTNIGKYLYLAAEKLVKEYDSNAENIWLNVSAKKIVKRLEDFKGISHKKASLACLLLIRDLDLKIKDKENVDIIYDIHIRRIFLRAGFCQKDTLLDVVEGAKKLYPEFPGYLTSAFWAIGREICRPSNPHCDECPIKEFCKKQIELGDNIHA